MRDKRIRTRRIENYKMTRADAAHFESHARRGKRDDKSGHIVDPILPAARTYPVAGLLSIHPDMLGVRNRGNQQVRPYERLLAGSQEAFSVSSAVWRSRRTVVTTGERWE